MHKDRTDRGTALTSDQQDMEHLLLERTKAALVQLTALPAPDADEALGLLIDWSLFESDEAARTFVRSHIDEGGPWVVEEVVGWFASVNISGSARWAGDVSLDLLDRLLGVDFAMARFEFEGDPTIRWHDHAEPTWAERRRRAHHVLANEAEQRRSSAP